MIADGVEVPPGDKRVGIDEGPGVTDEVAEPVLGILDERVVALFKPSEHGGVGLGEVIQAQV